MRPLLALLALVVTAAVVAPGCAVIESDYGAVPTDAALRAIVPGQTSRAEVFRLLGPPEEFRYPNAFESGRSFSPPVLRIREEHRVFDLDTVTYVHEHKTRRLLFLLVFRLTLENTHADRVFVTFDGNGVVHDLSIAKDADET